MPNNVIGFLIELDDKCLETLDVAKESRDFEKFVDVRVKYQDTVRDFSIQEFLARLGFIRIH